MTTEEQKERRESFIKAARPLMEWMGEHCHPHTVTLVDSRRAELNEGMISYCTEEFVKD